MNFKEAYERYRRGEAAPAEAALVEEELEKFRLLTDHLAEEELPPLPEPGPAAAETYRRARRAVKRRSVWMVLLSVAIACALALGGPAVYRHKVVPWLNETVYYNPEQTTYSGFTTDFNLILSAMTELFSAEYTPYTVSTENTGPGRYTFRFSRLAFLDNQEEPVRGTLDRGAFRFEEPFFGVQVAHNLLYDTMPFDSVPREAPETTAARLEAMPNYVELTAAASFSRDLSMEELAALADRHPALTFGWVGVRAAELTEQRTPLVGFRMQKSGLVLDFMNGDYPCFWLEAEEQGDGGAMAEHVKALLRYVSEHPDLADPILPGAAPYAKDRLDYLEAHGVYTYGVYVLGLPADLAALCREEAVCQVLPQDLRLTVPA